MTMKKFLAFIVLFLLSFSLVLAVEVSTNQVEYRSGEIVTATISDCVGTSIVEFSNPSGSLVDIKTGEGSWSTAYNTLSDSEDGKYNVEATCTNGVAQSYFCVDDPGCIATVQPSARSTEEAVPSGRGGTGGTSCTAKWSCGEWSFCGPTLTQTRSCADLNRCQKDRTETQPCQACEESWVCSVWAECSAGSQTRVCYDEHLCETFVSKPALQKGCDQAEPFPQPVQISAKLPPPYVPPAVEQSFWDNYKYYLIGGLAAIILAVLILVGIHIFAPKKVAYNINELKQWVRKEKEMGTSDADIRQILKQNTGWTDEEMDMAFEGLQQPSRTISTSSAA